MLTYHKTTEEEKFEVGGWRYDGEYAVYDLPPYEEQLKLRMGLANPKNCFYSFTDGDRLIGFINLIERETEVFFGIGVAPALCGRGYGREITEAACALSHQLFPGKPVFLEVQTWNTRAVRCYEKAGFRIVGEPVKRMKPSGEVLYYRMTEDETAVSEAAVRKARPEDAEAAAALASRMWEDHDPRELADEFRELINSEEAAVFLKYNGGKPVAFAQCQLRHDYVEGTESSPVGYLEGVFVEDGCRRKGYAAELLAACEKWAKGMGCAEFASDCELGNETSLKFHIAMGFEEANRIICFRKKL